MIFLRVFFFTSLFQTVKTSFFPHELQQFVSTAHANELCAVCVMTEESLKRYPVCVLVPFLADRKDGIFDFILN